MQNKEQQIQNEKLINEGQNNKQQQKLFIFQAQELNRIQFLKTSIITKPLTFLFITTGLVLFAKRIKLRRILANPLRDQQSIANNDKYWKFAIVNGIAVGTLGFVGFSFYRSEINKILIYKKYEKQIGMYMKWRLQKQIPKYIRQNMV